MPNRLVQEPRDRPVNCGGQAEDRQRSRVIPIIQIPLQHDNERHKTITRSRHHSHRSPQSHLILHGKDLKPFRGKIKTNGLKGSQRRYYEKDYTHRDVEVYDRYGNHLGSMDPKTGELTKDPDPKKSIDL